MQSEIAALFDAPPTAYSVDHAALFGRFKAALNDGEGTVIKRRAVLGSGTILTRSTPVYDIVRGEIYSATAHAPLVIPEELLR